MVIGQAEFPQQVTTDLLSQNIFYIIAASAVVVAVAGLCLIDMGLVQRRNVLDTVVQKVVGFLIATGAYAIVGFGVWQWQFYEAFEVAKPYSQAISDWWIAGSFMTEIAGNLDPELAPAANNSQIFLVFLAVYAGFVAVLVHLGGLERIKPSAYYVICAGIGGVVYPLLLWLTWGSTSPLTNAGVHDFLGAFVGYIFAGAFALILARKLRPRLGVFREHPGMSGLAAPYNLGLTAVGVVLLMFAIPLVSFGCLYFFPKEGFFGIAMSSAGLGIMFANVFMAFAGGAITGAILGYRRKNVVYALLGPLAGSVAGASGFDVLDPWVMGLVGLGAPIPVMLVYDWLQRNQIDEAKIVPLGLGAGIYGALAVGILEWGTPTGGFFGIEEGTFAFQNAEINLVWQLVGVGVAIGFAVVAGLVLVYGLDRLIGLRVSEQHELEGSDPVYWRAPAIGAELAPPQEAPVSET